MKAQQCLDFINAILKQVQANFDQHEQMQQAVAALQMLIDSTNQPEKPKP